MDILFNSIKRWKIFTGSADSSIIIYNNKTFKPNFILNNKQLVSCSFDKSIIFYNKYNNKYKKDYSITTKGENGPIIQTKDN